MFSLLAESTGLVERMNLEGVVANLRSYVVDHGPEFAINVLSAIAIAVVGRWIAKIVTGLLSRVFEGAKLDETLAKFLKRIVYTLMLLFVAMAALDRLGVNTTSLAAIAAAAGLAIGLALQGSLANVAAGVMIILFRLFKVGDFVEAGGAKGVVEEIHIFHTLMRTDDNVQLVVPNNAVTSGNIANYSAKETRRIDLVVGCGYGDDLPTVKRLLCEMVNNEPWILRDPEPVVAVGELADNSVTFVVRPWVANSDYWPVRWDLTEAVKVGFDERGFSIPFPQRDLYVHQVGVVDPQQLGADPVSAQPRPVDGTLAGTSPAADGSVQAFNSGSPIDIFEQADQTLSRILARRAG